MSIPQIQSYPMPHSMPANRVKWAVDPARAVLLIHDMQEYFLDFYDQQAAPIPTLIDHVLQLRAACDASGVPVYYSAQSAQQSAQERGLLQDWWGPGLTAKPERAGIVPLLAARASDTVLAKWRYSAFVRSDFLQRIQQAGRDQIIVCGVYAHIGCLMTCADAFMKDIQPFLAGDALADFSAEQHQQGLDYVAQRCGVVAASAELCRALLGIGVPACLPQTLAGLKVEIAQLLHIAPTELDDEENLLLAGLDSIRLMHLLTRWQRAGADVSFVTLGQKATLLAWWQLLQPGQAQRSAA